MGRSEDRAGEARRHELTRRGFLALTAASGASALAASPTPAGAVARAWGPSAGFAGKFAAPPRPVQAKFRWWWPHGLVDPAEIAREIDQIADAGFGGVEIQDVHHSVGSGHDLDPAGHGWGTGPWLTAVETALAQARRRGVVVDIAVGPSWPAAVPTITPDDEAAVQELAHGLKLLAAGETHSGPLPHAVVEPSAGVTDQRLLAVQAARVVTLSTNPRTPSVLDRASLVDLTGDVQDGALTWTAPDEGQWALISYWERGSGQQPEAGPHSVPEPYVIDHFSRAGTQAVIDAWESMILTPRIRRLLRDAGGALFEDSLELETEATLWTPVLPEAFERQRGYSLLPYLPVLLEVNERPVFDFDADTTRRVRRDVWETLSQLYLDEHVVPLRDWAHGLGLQLRIQPYGLETDAIAAAATMDIPEGESLGFKNLEDFRCLAGGRDMGGRRILSNEAGATAGGAYATTWQALVTKLVTQYSAGVNQAVLHGFSYASAPGAAWPGFAAFTPYGGRMGYGESWGPRQPTWEHTEDVAGYLARTQLVLQTGTNRIDVATLRQKGYAGSGFGAPWFEKEGVPLGWTHQILSERLLHLPLARVASGRLAPDGPAYKALVFEGDAFSSRATELQVSTVEKLLTFARAGLPIVVVGNWSAPKVPGLPKPGENERLAALMAELLAQPTVRNVPDRPDIPTGLAALGIARDVEHERSTLLNAHRQDGRTDLYFLANGSATAPLDQLVTLKAAGGRGAVPFRVDAWTGKVEPLALFDRPAPDRIRVRVTLAPGQTTVVALAAPGWAGRGAAPGWLRPGAATSTEADAVRATARGLVIRDTTPGTYATTLHNGRTVRGKIADVPAPIPLTRWELEVEDWQPGATPTETRKPRRRLTLDGLKAWKDVPGLEDVSGVGRYRATVDLREPWSGGFGAMLELGEVFDTYRVKVNGRALPPADLVAPTVDVGPYLRRGRNVIEVEVATTLLNRLRVTDPTVYGVAARQAYGLVGPVRLVPYGEAPAAGR